MRMIPSADMPGTSSEAERIVFDYLASVQLPGGMVFHSLSISEHEYKRWGELDFVVLSPGGLIALEIKGGVFFSRFFSPAFPRQSPLFLTAKWQGGGWRETVRA